MNEQSAKPSLFKRILKLSLKLAAVFFITSILSVILFKFVPVPYTPLMFWKSTASLFSEKFVGINHDWVPIEQISKSMQRAVIKAEDYKFYQHNGFDFEAIQKAIEYNKTHKRKIGASTISQQTAKNVFLWPSRSWIRKGLEVYFTVLIEFFWSKERIIEVYLNVIEVGPGIYGVEAGAQKFFKKPAKKLNSHEASLMAAVLPNPIKFRVDKPSRYVLRRQRKILGTKIAAQKAPEVEKTTITEFFDIKFDQEDESEKANNSNGEKNNTATDSAQTSESQNSTNETTSETSATVEALSQ